MPMPVWTRAKLTWAVFAVAVLGTGAFWHGPRARSPEAKPADLAGPAEPPSASSTRLVVDFRDDVSPAALAANGYAEIPVSDYSTRDRLYAIDFASHADAEAARAKLAASPDVESVDYD